MLLALLLITGCVPSKRPPSPRPLYPPGPYITAALGILAHGRPALAAAWRQDGLDAVAAVPITGDVDHDGQARALALAQADDAWIGVWLALTELRAAERAYTATRAAGKAPDEKRVRVALCGLQEAVPMRWRILVLPVVVGCP